MERSCLNWFEGICASLLRNTKVAQGLPYAHIKPCARLSYAKYALVNKVEYIGESNRGVLSVLRLLSRPVLRCRRRIEQTLHLH
jgi:hypothetical protein